MEEGITEDQIKVIEELDDLSVEKANKCSKVGGYLLGYLLETLNVYKEYEVLKMKGELKNFNLHEENLKKKIEAFEKLTNKW